MTDEEAVRRTLYRFCTLLDDRQFKDWSELFIEEGVFTVRKSRAEIYEQILTGDLASRPNLRRKHTISNLVIDIDGDEARATSDLVMFDRETEDEPWTIRVGRYTDRLVRRGTGWLIAERQLVWT